jgi:hypothetical protein
MAAGGKIGFVPDKHVVQFGIPYQPPCITVLAFVDVLGQLSQSAAPQCKMDCRSGGGLPMPS